MKTGQRGLLKKAAVLLFATLAAWLVLSSGGNAAAAAVDPSFQPVVVRLVNSGFNKTWVESLFNQPCMTLFYKVLILRLTVRESKIDYGQFLDKKPIQDGKAFLKKHQKAFSDAQARQGVPGEIITAILLLETRLGTYTGKFETLRTLATHTAAANRQVAEQVYGLLPEAEKKRYTKTSAAARLARRNGWFYGELKAFLRYLEQTRAAPCAVKGSYTGAIGLCQFQPSNLKPYGRDGNGDGVVDLFTVEDAIMSAAAYLKNHGWKENLSRPQQVRKIMTYNNSTRYAETIMEVADRLKE